MIEVDISQKILLLFFKEGLSRREIARRLKVNRKTVSRRIEQYQSMLKTPASKDSKAAQALAEYLQKGQVYNSSNRKPRILTEEIARQIDAYLEENAHKRAIGLKKQQLRKIDIHEKLLELGYQVSYSSVCKYAAARLSAHQEAFIKQQYAPGSVVEFDWGEVKLRIAGKYRRFYLAVFTSAYSNYRYAILFERENSLAFREAHILFFSHVGGVWRQVVYDNMRVAVLKFVGKTEKQPTEALQQLGRWYMFDWRYCNIASGNEKGHVERSIEYVRRKCFAFKDDFESLEQAQQYLLERLSKLNKRVPAGAKMSPYELLQQERSVLGHHPGAMECFDMLPCRVDKWATICIGTNRYSVPDHLVGRKVYAKCYSSRIVVHFEDKVVCLQPRNYGRGQWQIDLNHFLKTLERKPGAVKGSVAMKQAPAWLQKLYKAHFHTAPRSFVELLLYCRDKEISHRALKDTVDRLLKRHPHHIDADHITALLGNNAVEVVESTNDLQPDAIAMQALENLNELNTMMEGIIYEPSRN